jgi:hypothetical protein
MDAITKVAGEDRFSMIEVQSLTKRYGAKVAVDDLTFGVEQGKVTGFLGPNGAGNPVTELRHSLPPGRGRWIGRKLGLGQCLGAPLPGDCLACPPARSPRSQQRHHAHRLGWMPLAGNMYQGRR